MKKIGITLLTAFFGGAVAIGGYKLIENNNTEKMSIEDKQKVYFTNNPVSVSSAGDVDFVQAAAAVTPAVVHIQTTYGGSSRQQRGGGGGDPFEDMFRDFFGSPRGNTQRAPAMASGSGVIVSDDGYIVTNNHVVEDASKIEVILPDNRSFQAKVIGRDPNTDLALLKVNATKLPVVKLGNSDNVQVGEWVLAVGYPLTLNTTVTAGIVSAKGRAIGILGQPEQEDYYGNRNQPRVNSAIESFIQTDAAINRGNSGGALVNTRGELVGINAAIASQTGYYAGYGFAIPVNLAKKIMDDFIKYGAVRRGFVGVTFQELNSSIAKELGVSEISGLYVNTVVEGSGAAAAGIKKGDVITKVDGARIMSSSDLQERVARLRPGDKVQLSFNRDGKERTVSVTLKGEDDVKIAGNNNSSAEELYNQLGASFAPVSTAQKQRYKINSGVVVTEARDGGLFSNFGIEKGTIITSINNKPINKVDDIDNALSASSNNMIRINGISADGSRIMMSFPVAQ
ncbi:Do family serine endopeptidase [Arcticibacter tournemirensis]|uniref:Do family serine endopeptidase n=1 Tax=Arcticibacter tournemirensis TaxID=699437 RepID=A0A4Q0MED2_9SPHI|nr:Do family serine endopeptidase [Arcticibacter tournemirensis]RXF71594.1 Do family serine endopeptidase [Arcticibacter tournemirensis]